MLRKSLTIGRTRVVFCVNGHFIPKGRFMIKHLVIPAFLLLGLVAVTFTVQAQPRFEVPITATDGVVVRMHYFGILPGASFCIAYNDSINGHAETYWPPIPPTGVFDSRFQWPRSGANAGCFDQGTPYDFRPFTSYNQRDTFKISMQLGQGAGLFLSWPAGLANRFIQLTLKYVGNNGPVYINMLDTTGAEITEAGDPAVAYIYSVGLAGPLLAPPALLMPVNGAVNVSPLPTLTWSAISGATYYRVQIAHDSTFAVVAYDDSSIASASCQAPQLATNTRYFWRVASRNPVGTGIFSAAFRFTTSGLPAAPPLISPPDSAVRLSRTPTLVWARIFSATSYHVQVASDPAFTSMQFNDSTIVDTSVTIPAMPYGARLYWRVKTRVGTLSSVFSTPRTFTVMLEPPAMPTLQSPLNNAMDVPVATTLAWGNVPLASTYNLQIAFDTLMSNLMVNDTAVGVSNWPARLQPSTTFFWRVRGRNTERTYGPFSAVWRFATGNVAPTIPVPTYPANGDTGITRTTTLTWIGSPGASSYRMQIARDSLFTQQLQDDSTITGTSAPSVPLPPLTTCYWRVRAKGSAGSSAYCTAQRFRTGFFVGVNEPEEAAIPGSFRLYQNYPNPFNPSTTFQYDVPLQSQVTLSIFDVLGRQVAEIVDQVENAGHHEVQWNAVRLAGGVYYCRFSAGTYTTVSKLILLK
jgi:hypothetical protein